jgi:hypothetical protein
MNTSPKSSGPKAESRLVAQLTIDEKVVDLFDLPAIPSTFFHHDGSSKSLVWIPTMLDTWTLQGGKQKIEVRFGYSIFFLQHLLKSWCRAMLRDKATPSSVAMEIATLQTISEARMCDVLDTPPQSLTAVWSRLLSEYPSATTLKSLKALLRFLCSQSRWGHWNPDGLASIDELPLPQMVIS